MDEDIDDLDDLEKFIADEIALNPLFAVSLDNASASRKIAYQYYVACGDDENLEEFMKWSGSVFIALGYAGYRIKVEIEKVGND